MKLRFSSHSRPILTILVIAMLGVGLACAGEKATPTSPPTATTAPTATATTAPTATLVPTATATLVPGEPTPTATAIPTATATAVPTPTVDIAALPWAERLMQSPGYKPEWGTPKYGGIFKMGMPKNPDNLNFSTTTTTPGPHAMVPFNSLLRFDPWVGQTSIIGDMAKSWEWSGDSKELTIKWPEGIKLQDNTNIPAEYNGGKIGGDEFVCEDVKASVEFFVWPPKAEYSMPLGPSMLGHLDTVSCPDGPRGYTALLSFNLALGKTLNGLSEGHMIMLDKNWIEWMNAENPNFRRYNSPERFKWLTGYGAFVPLEFKPDVMTKHRRNPTYWREGLPLLDGIDLYILKDFTTRFTALATGQVHYFGHGSYGMLPGQVAQAERDFKGRIVISVAQHVFGYGVKANPALAPYNDRRVRQAMQLAIDRDDYLEFNKSGSYPGSILMGSLVPNTYWSPTEAELRTWPGIRQPHDQDVAEANRLLDEVFGVGKRFKGNCQADSGQSNVDTCLFFMDQMKRHLNIDVTLEVLEVAVNTQRKEAGLYNVAEGSHGNTKTGDPDEYFFGSISTRNLNALGAAAVLWLKGVHEAEPVLYPELEALMDEQSLIVDPVKRRALVVEIDRRLTVESAFINMYGWNMAMFGTTPNLKGYSLQHFQGNLIWSNYERLWLAD